MQASTKTHILFLAANPTDETRLRLGNESTRIKEALDASTGRDHFVFHEEHSVRLDSLQRLILRSTPHIIHFSGHGSRASELIFEDSEGQARPADPEAIAEVFRILHPQTRLVVLNACYSERQGEAIARHVEAVIGMTLGIADQTAIAFSKSLYESLGEGSSTQQAFDLARNYVRLQGLPGHELPKLITGARPNPS